MRDGDKIYEVRNSPIHGKGVFAARDIKKGERIIEYLGEKISKEESNRRGVEREELAKKTDIDGNFDYNDARYINHACRTNSESVCENGRIFIYATRDIKKGEEILYNYGYAFENFIDHPCKCGFPECVGYIVAVEDRLKLKKRLRGKKPKKSQPGASHKNAHF